MEWKDAYELLSKKRVPKTKVKQIVSLFEKAKKEGVFDDLMNDEYARKCYEIIYGKQKYPVKTKEHNEEEPVVIDGVCVKFMGDKVQLSVHNGEIDRDIIVDKEIFDKIVAAESKRIVGFRCQLCGKMIGGEGQKDPEPVRFTPLGLAYHEECYNVLRYGLKYLVRIGGI